MKWFIIPVVMAATAAAIHIVPASASPATQKFCDTQAECRNIDTVIAFYNAAINEKDFAKADRYLGSEYIQHHPGAADGAAGLKGFIEHLRKDLPQYHSDILRAFATGHYVIVHVHNRHQPGTRGFAIMDIFRLSQGKIVEHWDVRQSVPAHSTNGHTMFD